MLQSYVKALLLYQRGTLFGHTVNHPEKLATTISSFMIKCQHIVDTINSIDNGRALTIITDGNQINQHFFATFKTVESKTWFSISGIYLLCDYVVFSIQNSWLTEKTGQLQFLHS